MTTTDTNLRERILARVEKKFKLLNWNPDEIGVPRSEKFPVSYAEMLRLLMPSVDKTADREARFREYLASTPDMRKNGKPIGKEAASDWIAAYRKSVFYKDDYWLNAHGFLRWWKVRLGERRREASLSRKKAKKKLGGRK